MANAIISFPLLGNLTLDPPRYFRVFGFQIYFYGVIIGMGFLLAAVYVLRRAKDFDLTQDNILDMLLCAVPLAIVGARLYFVLFTSAEGLEYYLSHPVKIITGIREGGMAIYGGVIGGALGAWLFSRVKKVSFGSLADIGGLGLLIGQAIGRWGNFVNREAFGGETGLPWRMGLTTDAGTIYVHPTFLYESLWNAVGLILLHIYTKRFGRRFNGQIFSLYLGWYGLGRFWIEGLRTDSLYLLGTGIPVSQLVAGLCVIGAIALNAVMIPKKKRSEG